MRRRLFVISGGALSVLTLLSISKCTSSSPRPNDIEWPPSLSTLVQQAPTVAFCQLVNNPAQFNGKLVRTQAIFYADAENEVLYDLMCEDERSLTWVSYDASYVYSDKNVKKRFEDLLCLTSPCPSGKVNTVVVGRFEGPSEKGYGHLNGYRYQFVIMRMEQAEPIVSSMTKNIP